MNAFDRIANKSVVGLRGCNLLSDTAAQACFVVTSKKDKQSVCAAIAEYFGGKVRAEASTLRMEDVRGETLARVVVRTNNIRMPLRDAKNMTVISANVMKDSMDNIWGVEGRGDSAVITQRTEEDLAAMLKARSTKVSLTASVLEPAVNIGEYVMFYDTASASNKFGFVLEDGTVMERATHKVLPLDLNSVVESTEVQETDELARLGSNAKEDVLEYYRLLYGNNPKFFNHLEELIDAQ